MKKRKKINGYKVVSVLLPKNMYDDMKQGYQSEGVIQSDWLRLAISNEILERKKRRLADEWSKLVRK